MQLTRIQDPRDTLAKARRRELYMFAVKNNVVEISKSMPADLMRKILRRRGLTNMSILPQALGALPKVPRMNVKVSPDIRSVNNDRKKSHEPRVVEADADDDLERQWRSELAASNPHGADKAVIPQEVKKTRRPRGANRSSGLRGANESSVAVVRPTPFKDPARPKMFELKSQCKRLGLTMPRTAKRDELLEAIRNHGENAS